MAYALFAQKKVQLTGALNAVSLQQTQRSNEQYLLATNTLSLNQQMSSLQAAQSIELADLFKLLTYVGDKGYSASVKDPKNKDLKDSLDAILAKYDLKESELTTDAVNAKIKETQAKQDAKLEEINIEIYKISVKENAIEMEVKRLDTKISALQKQLEAVQEAEGKAIDRATPKFQGIG